MKNLQTKKSVIFWLWKVSVVELRMLGFFMFVLRNKKRKENVIYKMDGIMNLSEHMTVIDNEGNKTSVIMYYADYQEIVDIIGRYKMLFEFESSLNASLDQMKQMKTDKSANKSLQSLIDEL